MTSLSQLNRIAELSGQDIPKKLLDFLGEGDDKVILERGIEYAATQCRDLLRHGVAGIHLYTFNRATSAVRITKTLRAEGYFPVQKKGK